MSIDPIPDHEKPAILFRVECDANRMLNRGNLCARRTRTDVWTAPERQEFDDHLSWKPQPSRFVSFTSSWRRAMRRQQSMESQGRRDIVVIAIWSKDLMNLYDAERVATMLGYSDTGPDPRRRVRNHYDEYLLDGGIEADEYRILALFEGRGPDRDIVFKCPSLYRVSTSIRDGFFPGKRSNNPLQDLEDEIYSNTGVRNDRKRDALVTSISGGTFWPFPITYK